MASQPANGTPNTKVTAQELGRLLRDRRNALNINMTTAAESAGMSRFTWHRLEKGEPSVALAHLIAAAHTLGFKLTMHFEDKRAQESDLAQLPLHIELAKYPGLRTLAWQVGEHVDALTPREAFGIYRRNIRHLPVDALTDDERHLLTALQMVFDEVIPGV